MFSSPRPELINFPDQSKTLAKILDHDDFNEKRQISNKALQDLPPMGEPAGTAVGFFEQGLLTGLVVSVTSIVAMLVVSKIYVLPAIVARIRR